MARWLNVNEILGLYGAAAVRRALAELVSQHVSLDVEECRRALSLLVLVAGAGERRRRRPTYVYAIQAGPSGPVKIGTSLSPAARLRQIQTDQPLPLELRVAVRGDLTLERLLHSMFRPWRLRGEWYEASGAVAEWLDEHPVGRVALAIGVRNSFHGA